MKFPAIFTAIRNRVIPTPTVGKVMAGFEKQKRQLDAARARADADTAALTESIAALRTKRVDAISEAAKAERIARRLKEFTA